MDGRVTPPFLFLHGGWTNPPCRSYNKHIQREPTMTNKELTLQLVSLLQAHRDLMPEAQWEALDGSPLMDALDAIADLEYEVEEKGYLGGVLA